jgi:uncharacterized damage-inducible protein DinB
VIKSGITRIVTASKRRITQSRQVAKRRRKRRVVVALGFQGAALLIISKMLPRLVRQFSKLETSKEAVLRELREWPDGTLGQRPDSGGWSALEVIEHVTLTERSILEAMRRNIRKPRRVRTVDWLKNGVVMCTMLLPARVKIPAGAPNVAPTGQPADLIAMANAWDAARRDLAAFLDAAREGDRNAGVVRHPAGGWTTMEGALWFLRSHLRHHRYQLARIRAALR